jgi:transcriptional regulator with XRE-family HTH domain
MSETTPPDAIHRDELTWLADQFAQARRQAGLDRKELVRRAGYQNITRGLRRLDHIESGTGSSPDSRVLDRFADVLDIDMTSIWETIRTRDDERRREAWEKPLPDDPTVQARLVPAVYPELDFPDRLSLEELFASASRFAQRRNCKVWATFEDGRTIYFEPDGTRWNSFGTPAMYV